MAAKAGLLIAHQPKFVGEDEIIRRASEMDKINVAVDCGVAEPPRHRHNRGDAAAAGNEQARTLVVDSGEPAQRPVSAKRIDRLERGVHAAFANNSKDTALSHR